MTDYIEIFENFDGVTVLIHDDEGGEDAVFLQERNMKGCFPEPGDLESFYKYYWR